MREENGARKASEAFVGIYMYTLVRLIVWKERAPPKQYTSEMFWEKRALV